MITINIIRCLLKVVLFYQELLPMWSLNLQISGQRNNLPSVLVGPTDKLIAATAAT